MNHALDIIRSYVSVYISTVWVPKTILGPSKPLLCFLQTVPKPRQNLQSWTSWQTQKSTPAQKNKTHLCTSATFVGVQVFGAKLIFKSSKPLAGPQAFIFNPYVKQPCSTVLFSAPGAPVEHGDVVAEPPPQVFAGHGRGSDAKRGQRGVANIIQGTTLLILFRLAGGLGPCTALLHAFFCPVDKRFSSKKMQSVYVSVCVRLWCPPPTQPPRSPQEAAYVCRQSKHMPFVCTSGKITVLEYHLGLLLLKLLLVTCRYLFLCSKWSWTNLEDHSANGLLFLCWAFIMAVSPQRACTPTSSH